MLFCFFAFGLLFQLISVQSASGDDMFDESERNDFVHVTWPKNDFEPEDYSSRLSDLLRAWNEKESDTLENSNIPEEVPDLQNYFLKIKSYTDTIAENDTIDIQNFLDKIESNEITPLEIVTIDFRDMFKYNTDIPNINFEIETDQNGRYSSYYRVRRIAGISGFIITLILAPFIIYRKYKTRKDLKLRIFVISRKTERKEPLISV